MTDHGNGEAARVHLSKSTWNTWRTCRERYRFEKVDKVPADDGYEDGRAAVRGTATHEAVAHALQIGARDPDAVHEVASQVLARYSLPPEDAENAAKWAARAVAFVRSLGGQRRWVEELLSADFGSVVLWAKTDVCVYRPGIGLEVVDFTFGARRVVDEDGLLGALGTKVSRLVAGGVERDASVRPIRITEFHGPSDQTITVVPTDGDVRAWFAELHAVADEIRTARSTRAFPAAPGAHCAWCPWRAQCPAGRPLEGPPL